MERPSLPAVLCRLLRRALMVSIIPSLATSAASFACAKPRLLKHARKPSAAGPIDKQSLSSMQMG